MSTAGCPSNKVRCRTCCGAGIRLFFSWDEKTADIYSKTGMLCKFFYMPCKNFYKACKRIYNGCKKRPVGLRLAEVRSCPCGVRKIPADRRNLSEGLPVCRCVLPYVGGNSAGLFQMFAEKSFYRSERDDVFPVVKVGMVGSGNHHEDFVVLLPRRDSPFPVGIVAKVE